MKSRILAVLFAVVLTAGTLAGCGSSKKADDTKAETTDEKSEDKASSDEDTKDVNVASEEEAEEAAEYRGPKSIGQIFGISYIFSMFLEFGLIRTNEKDKIEKAKAEKVR